MATDRLSRRELKHTDEITSTLETFVDRVIARKKEVVAGLVGLLVLVGGVIGWRAYASNQENTAQARLGAVIAAFTDSTVTDEKQRFTKTIEEAEKVISEYRGTDVGRLAQYYLGLSQAGLGDLAKGEQTLGEVAGGASGEIKAVAQVAIAGVHRSKGDTAKAIEAYKQVLDSGGAYPKTVLLYELAKLSEESNPTQAKEYYQRILTENSDSVYRTDADQAIRKLGGTPTYPQPAAGEPPRP